MIKRVKIIKPEIFGKYNNLVCGISTRYGPDSNPPFEFNLSYKVGDNPEQVNLNRKAFFDELGIKETDVSFQFQVHSAIHNYVEKTSFFSGSDGLFTDKKGLFMAINIADCVPVFIYDPVNEVVAGIHSGWKGTQQQIVTHTINTLIQKYNSMPDKLLVYIGPGISFKNFEVGKEVFDMFEEDFREVRNGKLYVDLKKDIFTRLLRQGVKTQNVEVSHYCTFKDKELFHSFRRDGEKSGRMLGVIGMRE